MEISAAMVQISTRIMMKKKYTHTKAYTESKFYVWSLMRVNYNQKSLPLSVTSLVPFFTMAGSVHYLVLTVIERNPTITKELTNDTICGLFIFQH